MTSRELTIALVTMFLCASSTQAQPPGLPFEPVEVEVLNLPQTQSVAGTVEVSNLPEVQAVEVVEPTREQVRLAGLDDFDSPASVQMEIERASDDFKVDLGAVPLDKKLVITDILVRSNTTFNSWHCASIAGADDCSDGSLVGVRRISVCVEPNYAAPAPGPNDDYDYFKTVSLATGIEFLPGQKVCLGAGGGRIDDGDFVQAEAIGYLTNP